MDLKDYMATLEAKVSSETMSFSEAVTRLKKSLILSAINNSVTFTGASKLLDMQRTAIHEALDRWKLTGESKKMMYRNQLKAQVKPLPKGMSQAEFEKLCRRCGQRKWTTENSYVENLGFDYLRKVCDDCDVELKKIVKKNRDRATP